MSNPWMEMAVRDRLDPVVVGFVWSTPRVLREVPPGVWDAVSDCFSAPGYGLSHRRAGAMLDWSVTASEFLGFARMCEAVPSVSTALSGRGRMPAAPALCAVLGLMVARDLDARSRAGEDVSGVAMAFLERALDEMPPDAATLAVSAAVRWYGIPLSDPERFAERAGLALDDRA